MTATVVYIVASSYTQLHCGWTPLQCQWICNSFYQKSENQGKCQEQCSSANFNV